MRAEAAFTLAWALLLSGCSATIGGSNQDSGLALDAGGDGGDTADGGCLVPCSGACCQANEQCSAGRCVTCVPNCGTKVCGVDGQGCSCGVCKPTEVCTSAGQCEACGNPCGSMCCRSGEVCNASLGQCECSGSCVGRTVTSLSAPLSSVGQYQKFEITFQIDKGYSADSMLPYYFYDPSDTPANDPDRNSPYGVDGVTVDAHFRPPGCAQPNCEKVVPAFYYQDYVRGGSVGSNETMTATTSYAWKVRFAPEQIGAYAYYLVLADRTGESRYPLSGALAFTSVASPSKGFVRVSPRDPRFLEYSNGESFVPIGRGHQWWRCCGPRSWDFEKTFDDFGANGINWVRIWDQNDGYSLTVESHFDAYTYPDDYNPEDRGIDLTTIPKGTQMNQRGNYEEDKILEAAERNGVLVQLCSHEDPYWTWDAPRTDETAFQRVNYWKRNFRYRVARWGYSTSVLAWEHWNELGHVPVNSRTYAFYQSYGQYQAETDPFRHLRTTSQGSQAWSPAFWSSPAFDLANYHDYMMPGRYPADFYDDEVMFVYNFGQCLRMKTPGANCRAGDGSTWQGADKPIVWGELDTGTATWNQPNPQPRADHNVLWAGLFSPLGSVGLDWYWDSKTYLPTAYGWAKIASDYFKSVDYVGERLSYLSTADVRVTSELVTTTNPKMRVLAMRSASNKRAFVWVHNKDYVWGKGTTDTVTAISGSFTLPQMLAGEYTVEVTNTHTGQKTAGGSVSAAGGSLTLSMTNLENDVALKVSQ